MKEETETTETTVVLNGRRLSIQQVIVLQSPNKNASLLKDKRTTRGTEHV
jgi:hypothetical protein